MYGEIYDDQGIILPLQAYQMNIIPDPKNVDHFGRMYTKELVRQAERGRGDFELFMELHRRAAKTHLEGLERYDWDGSFENSRFTNANALFLRDYDRKWGIYERDGNSFMLRSGEKRR